MKISTCYKKKKNLLLLVNFVNKIINLPFYQNNNHGKKNIPCSQLIKNNRTIFNTTQRMKLDGIYKCLMNCEPVIKEEKPIVARPQFQNNNHGKKNIPFSQLIKNNHTIF